MFQITCYDVNSSNYARINQKHISKYSKFKICNKNESEIFLSFRKIDFCSVSHWNHDKDRSQSAPSSTLKLSRTCRRTQSESCAWAFFGSLLLLTLPAAGFLLGFFWRRDVNGLPGNGIKVAGWWVGPVEWVCKKSNQSAIKTNLFLLLVAGKFHWM